MLYAQWGEGSKTTSRRLKHFCPPNTFIGGRGVRVCMGCGASVSVCVCRWRERGLGGELGGELGFGMKG